jgi:GDP-L-fucose synthase
VPLAEDKEKTVEKSSKIYIAGHTGLVGSALVRSLKAAGYTSLITCTHDELDLTRQADVEVFFRTKQPEYVFLAAAKVGGILANSTYKAEFIYDNVMIAANVIQSAYKYGVKKLLNLGSSCIYPKLAPQPMKEEYFLTGSLEPTNEPYALAKIAAIKLCRYYNEQYGTNFISAMPSNLYGPSDNFDLKTSHVLAALIRKFHLAKLAAKVAWEAIKRDETIFGPIPEDIMANLIAITQSHGHNIPNPLRRYEPRSMPSAAITIWGTGNPYREFLYVDDLADAVIYLMNNYDSKDLGEFINIGTGEDLTIGEMAEMIREIADFKGDIKWDTSKPDGTPRKLLDISKLKNLGWRPKISLREGIERTYEEYLRK